MAVLALAACGNPAVRHISTEYAITADNAARAGDWSTARTNWKKAVTEAELAEAPPQALAILWYEYGRSSGVICDWAEAKTGLIKAYDLDLISNGPAFMSLFELARMNFDRKRYREAVNYFERVLTEFEDQPLDTRDPLGHADFLDEYAASLDNLGRGVEAKKHRRRSAKIRAAFPKAEPRTEKTPYGTQCEIS